MDLQAIAMNVCCHTPGTIQTICSTINSLTAFCQGRISILGHFWSPDPVIQTGNRDTFKCFQYCELPWQVCLRCRWSPIHTAQFKTNKQINPKYSSLKSYCRKTHKVTPIYFSSKLSVALFLCFNTTFTHPSILSPTPPAPSAWQALGEAEVLLFLLLDCQVFAFWVSDFLLLSLLLCRCW